MQRSKNQIYRIFPFPFPFLSLAQKCRSMIYGQQVDPEKLIMEKNSYGKTRVKLLQPPVYAGKNNYGKFWALPGIMGKQVNTTSSKC